MATPFLTRVRIKNYKSIAACDIRPGPLNFLVGPNGSGKSNFLDALQFLSDAARFPLDEAIRQHGGLGDILHRSTTESRAFQIGIEFEMGALTGAYSLQIGRGLNHGAFSIRESGWISRDAKVSDPATNTRWIEFESNLGSGRYRIDAPGEKRRFRQFQPQTDRLILNLKGFWGELESFPDFGLMRVFHPIPARMRSPQIPESQPILSSDGVNIASVFREIEKKSAVRDRICRFLEAVVPEVSGVEFVDVASYAALQFHVKGEGGKQVVFPARAMSDGTLRTLGILVALFQSKVLPTPLSVVGIEEPETALHPDAIGVLRDILMETSDVDFPGNVQVFVSTHSADLLETEDISLDHLFAVEYRDGRTWIGPIAPEVRDLIRDEKFTAGELMRINQLEPDPSAIPDPSTFDTTWDLEEIPSP